MSNRRIITDHFMVRWLERAEGVDRKLIRQAMERSGLNANHDGERLHFIGTYLGIDVDSMRRELHTVCMPAVAMGARSVKYRGYVLLLRHGVAKTLVSVKNRKLCTFK